MSKGRYITQDLVEVTNRKSIISAYDRNDLSIVLYNGTDWYMESCPAGIRSIVKREMEKHFPDYKYFTFQKRFVPTKRTALDGKVWWVVYDNWRRNYSSYLFHGKYKTKKACENAIDKTRGWA